MNNSLQLAVDITGLVEANPVYSYNDIFNGLSKAVGAFLYNYVLDSNGAFTYEAVMEEADKFFTVVEKGLSDTFEVMKEKADALRNQDPQG